MNVGSKEYYWYDNLGKTLDIGSTSRDPSVNLGFTKTCETGTSLVLVSHPLGRKEQGRP